ncbi:ATP-dependent Clp protease ATP-binding subunit [bacterium]|nr:ATP-dependent Clp protease ATP-binding subunit [bacterium]
MSTDDNYLTKYYSEAIDFEVLILELRNSTYIEDKLAYFVKNNGMIPKCIYDDYILYLCIANINQVIHRIEEVKEVEPNLSEKQLRAELIVEALRCNPLLNYENILINESMVLKLRTSNTTLASGEILLTENPHWEYTLSEDLNALDEALEDVTSEANELKELDDLDYKVKEKWWQLIGKYVKIKVYDKKDLASLLNNRYFHSSVSFNTFIVTICVIDFEELFQLLDNMGIPARVAPPLLMKELYNLCYNCNPFLTFENAQLYSDKANKDEEDTSCKSSCKGTSMSSMDQFAGKADKVKKTFATVPEEDLLNLTSNMKVSLIGQDKAVDCITEAIQRASVGLKDPVKPIGSFLFAGSTGTGKSLTAKILADELIKDRNNLITIDCSEYSADHEYSKLIGAPNGYTGFEQGGILTNAVIENPFSVVVFDEIEKASPKIFQLLLQVFDEGRLTDNKGVKVSFKDTVVILTSNLGVDEIASIGKTIGFGDVNVVTIEKKEKAIEKALKSKFKPEFLNRLDEIVYFNDLTEEDYLKIIEIELYKLNDNLQRNNTKYKTLDLVFDDKIKQFIYDKGINKEYGARPLKRAIEKHISTPLALKLLRDKVKPESLVNISLQENVPSFEISQDAAAALLALIVEPE